MFELILGIALAAAVVNPASAADTSINPEELTEADRPWVVRELCASRGEAALGIMSMRQDGGSINSALGIIENLDADDSITKKSFTKVIMDAWSEPLYLSETIRKRQIAEFGNRVELKCLVEYKY